VLHVGAAKIQRMPTVSHLGKTWQGRLRDDLARLDEMVGHGGELKHQLACVGALHQGDFVRSWLIQNPQQQMAVVRVTDIDQVAVAALACPPPPVFVPPGQCGHIFQRYEVDVSKGVGNSVDLGRAISAVLAKKITAVLSIRAPGFPEIEFSSKIGGIQARFAQLIANRFCQLGSQQRSRSDFDVCESLARCIL